MAINDIEAQEMLNKKRNNNIKRKRLEGIIFARVYCSIGIIIFHFFGYSKGNFKFSYTSANCDWGFMYVTTFFCISGSVIYYNYSVIHSLKLFYFKRWKSIFPSFYICYIYFFLKNAVKYHRLFFRRSCSYLFLTILGLDGYFRYKFKTYFLIGEWFLGAIIIIYILYPVILWIFRKNILLINFMIFIGYVLMFKTNFFIIKKKRNIITCIYSFYFGMLTIEFKQLFFKNKKALAISLIILIFLCFIRLPRFLLICQIQGFCLFIVLIQIGEYLMNFRFNAILVRMNSLTYNIFLSHKMIILDILSVTNPTEWYLIMILLIITIILTVIFAKILLIIVNSIIESKTFKIIEYIFLKI